VEIGSDGDCDLSLRRASGAVGERPDVAPGDPALLLRPLASLSAFFLRRIDVSLFVGARYEQVLDDALHRLHPDF
jgi:hypothetical protein